MKFAPIVILLSVVLAGNLFKNFKEDFNPLHWTNNRIHADRREAIFEELDKTFYQKIEDDYH